MSVFLLLSMVSLKIPFTKSGSTLDLVEPTLYGGGGTQTSFTTSLKVTVLTP